MRSIFALIMLINILLIASPCLAARWDLVLLTTSGLNGQLLPARMNEQLSKSDMVRTFGGFARIQSIFETYRKKYPGTTLTVATGDDLMGESLTNIQGKTVFRTMNKMGFDVSTLGNHEFDRGTKFLAKSLAIKKFPTVISNIKIRSNNRLGKKLKNYVIIERNNLKIGFLGMTMPNIALISNPGAGISVEPDFIALARKQAKRLKLEEKVDLVVLLSHLDMIDQKKILERVPEIDIICGGQSHVDILPGQEIIARDAVSPALMVQCGDHGREVGVLKIKIKNGVIEKHEWTIIPVTEQTKSDSEIEKYINENLKSPAADKILAISNDALDTRADYIRTQDTPTGRLICSIIKNKFKTDIAIQNGGGIRGNKVLSAGKITAEEINQMFPFGNTITILKVTGKTLKQILERSVHNLPKSSGCFLQTIGIKYSLDLKQQPQQLEINLLGKAVAIKIPGQRISNIQVKNKNGKYKAIQANKEYTIATNSYLANGGDGYLMLTKTTDKVITFIKIRDVVKSGLLNKQQIRTDSRPSILTTGGLPFYNK